MAEAVSERQQRLALRLFGSPQVRLDDHPVIHISSVKSRALLFYLAMNGHSQSRLALGGLLWPDKSDANARMNLRQALRPLRQALPDCLHTTREVIMLSPAIQVDVDATRFVAQAEVGLGGNSAALATAAACYTGDFLAGFYVGQSDLFDEWVLLTRERLHNLAFQVLHHLAKQQEATNQIQAALLTVDRLLLFEPWQEEFHRWMMRLLVRNGQLQAALAQYERCRQILQTEVNTTPDAETNALYAQIQSGLYRPTPEFEVEATIPLAPLLSPAGVISTNLPTPISTFIGREHEIEEICSLLEPSLFNSQHRNRPLQLPQNREIRLITIKGPGGVGKTRLALQTARRLVDKFTDGVWLVELATVTDPAMVARSIAAVLDISEEADRPLMESLYKAVVNKKLLILLDNCEHLIDACVEVVERLLGTTSYLKVLATSREALHIPGERSYPINPLTFPSFSQLTDYTALAHSDAVRLFADRAVQAQPAFAMTETNGAVVAQICTQLDGLPLAIELAAARVKVLSVEQIALQLTAARGGHLRLLKQGNRTVASRHQTLQTLMDWSYVLLSVAEQTLLRRLAIFVGGWTLTTAEAVCIRMAEPTVFPSKGANGQLCAENLLDILATLVDKSLVIAELQDHEMRYRMLEPIRQYAQVKLQQSDERGWLATQHLTYFVELTEQVEPHLTHTVNSHWRTQLEIERANIHAAIAYSHESGLAELGLRLVGALSTFWILYGYRSEGAATLHQFMTPLATTDSPEHKQKNRSMDAGFLQWWERGDYASARRHVEEALTLSGEVGDLQRVAASLNSLGGIAYKIGHFSLAQALLKRSLRISRAENRTLNTVWSLVLLGDTALGQAEERQALKFFEDAIFNLETIEAPALHAYALRRLGQIRSQLLPGTNVFALYLKSFQLNREINDRAGMAACAVTIAAYYATQKAWEKAAMLLGAAETLRWADESQLQPYDEEQRQHIQTLLQQQLDPSQFDLAWQRGRSMTANDIVSSIQQSPAVSELPL